MRAIGAIAERGVLDCGGREMPRRETDDAADVRVVPPLFPLAVIVVGVVLGRLRPVVAGLGLAPTVRYAIGGAVVVVVWTLGVWAVVGFRRTEQDPKPWKTSPELILGGPYRITRNPMYLMMVGTCIGVGVILGNVWILLLTPVCVWALQRFAIRPEETYLEAKFGEAFREYRRAVRRWI